MSNLNPQLSNNPDDSVITEHGVTEHGAIIEQNTASTIGTGAPYIDMRPRFAIRQSPPHVTHFLLAANVVVFVAMVAYGYFTYGLINGTEDSRVLLTFGAKFNQLVMAGETWRLFNAMFIHIGVIHLLFNLYALNSLGPLVEGYFGHLRFTAIYIVGGLFGSLASYAFSPNPSAGASGAIFGLAGCLAIYFYFYRENFGARGRAIFYNMIIVIGINFVFGLAQPGIDNWGHMGGLVGGALVTLGLLPRYKRPDVIAYGTNIMEEEPRQWLQIGWVVLCLVLWYFGLQWATERWLSLF